MGTPINLDEVLSIPVPNERDPEVSQILKELNEEIALLATGPISPIRKRSVPKINNRYHKKRGDWQLLESNNETEHKPVKKSSKKTRIRPYTGSTNNTLMSISVKPGINDTTKPRIVAIERLSGTITKTITCKNATRSTTETITSQQATTSAPTITVKKTTSTRVIPVITLGDELPPGFTPPPRIPEPVMESMLNMADPVTSRAKTTANTNAAPTIQVGKKKRKRHSRNKRHGLRYVRDGQTLYKITKRGGIFDYKIVENPIWRGPGQPTPNNGS